VELESDLHVAHYYNREFAEANNRFLARVLTWLL